MTETMLGFVNAEGGKTAVLEKPIPQSEPNDIIVRTAVLLCTSDVRTVRGAMVVPLGRTLGYESVSVIHAVGSRVTRLSVGQRVAAA